MNAWRFLDTGALPGALNMAVDQAILGLHANGKSPPTLRFYQWHPPAVSLGYCQKRHNLDLAACRRLGIEVVRRPSGGRAVLHMGDLTYAVIAGTADGMPSAVTAAYRLICDGLLQGFRRLGIDARLHIDGHVDSLQVVGEGAQGGVALLFGHGRSPSALRLAGLRAAMRWEPARHKHPVLVPSEAARSNNRGEVTRMARPWEHAERALSTRT